MELQEQLIQPLIFDRPRWDNWLLIVYFVVVAAYVLWLARHWHR